MAWSAIAKLFQKCKNSYKQARPEIVQIGFASSAGFSLQWPGKVCDVEFAVLNLGGLKNGTDEVARSDEKWSPEMCFRSFAAIVAIVLQPAC